MGRAVARRTVAGARRQETSRIHGYGGRARTRVWLAGENAERRPILISVWRIGSDTPDYTADDMTGSGARITGGGWNRAGTPVVYCSVSIALACLESVVHLR